MEYLKFYGLDEEPFRNDPDPRFYFESRAQQEVRVRLLRGLQQRRGLIVIVGPPGCGKTTLARQIPHALDRQRFMARALVVAHTSVDRGWLLRRIARAFGAGDPRRDTIRVLAQIYEQFTALQREGRHPVILLDEAQLLRDKEAMEEVRGLLNLEHQGRRLVSLVLLGMECLDEALRGDPALAQRMEIRTRLEGLVRDEVGAYLHHRLTCARAGDGIFTPEAVDAIHGYSSGVPRIVNTLADNALFEGFLARARPVDASLVVAAAEQLGLVPSDPRGQRARSVGSPDEEVPDEFDPGLDFVGEEESLSSLDEDQDEAATDSRAGDSLEGEDAVGLDALASIGGEGEDQDDDELILEEESLQAPPARPAAQREATPPRAAPPSAARKGPSSPPPARAGESLEDIDALFEDIQVDG